MCFLQVLTLGSPDLSGLQDNSIVDGSSILTRRLGLIIGCCLGFVVFILLISTLGYLKVKISLLVTKVYLLVMGHSHDF